MEPTLDIGQRILVDRIGLRFSSPRVGDVVVFHPPATSIPVPTPVKVELSMENSVGAL